MMSMMRRELVMLKRRGAQHFQLKEGKKIPKKPQESFFWTTHPGGHTKPGPGRTGGAKENASCVPYSTTTGECMKMN
jgi:hypothetical protein